IGAGIGDDLVANPGKRRDEQELEHEAAPARPAAERPLQPGKKLRWWFSGFDRHRRSPSRRRLADRRRVLDTALVPEVVEATGNAELGAGADVALKGLAVIAGSLHDPHQPVLGQAELL